MRRIGFFYTMLFSVLSSGAVRAESPIVWSPLCEPGGGGAIVSVQVNPHNPQALIGTGDMLSAAISEDGGDSWMPVFGFPSYEMCDVTFQPTEIRTWSGWEPAWDLPRAWTVGITGFPDVMECRA
ncbi:MAG: hypothetical protein JXR25_13570 [Pontiellaceae bacterium]|nr:hypothetical protein [Pontiellaceae bacterium]MBN2785845.1 hypothetical protein [Pontiellaceae bacterium]